MKGVGADTPTIDFVPIVQGFLNLFPLDLQSMLPGRDIDFGID